jgi:hypothetical protein
VSNDGLSRSATPKPKQGPDSTLHTLSEELKAVESSASNKLFDDLLSTYYTPLEVWYTRSAVDKVLSFFFFIASDDAEVVL